MDQPLQSHEPVAAGISDAGRVEANSSPQARQLRVGRARTLAELTDEYTFYTPALVFLHARLTFDPLAEFMQDYRREVTTFAVKFTRPIFGGLAVAGDRGWNHTLLAIGNEHWPAYENWLRGLAMVDRERDLLLQVRVSALTVCDPLWGELQQGVIGELPPTVGINMLCLETNKGSYYLSQPQLNGFELPQAMYLDKVYADTQALAEAALRGAPLPIPEPILPERSLQLSSPLSWDSLPEERREELRRAVAEANKHTKG